MRFCFGGHCRELYSNNLSGTIPKELGNITALVSLDLYQNNFTGTIPDSLGNLRSMRFLYVLCNIIVE